VFKIGPDGSAPPPTRDLPLPTVTDTTVAPVATGAVPVATTVTPIDTNASVTVTTATVTKLPP